MKNNNTYHDEPKTLEDDLALHKIYRYDPQRYLSITDGWISRNPTSSALFARHQVLRTLGHLERALADLNRAIELEADQVALEARGNLYMQLGAYETALRDFNHAEALDPVQWAEDSFGPLFQAHCHACLGDEAAALACCAKLPDDFWTPGIEGAPAGDKTAVAERLRVIAAAARAAPRGG